MTTTSTDLRNRVHLMQSWGNCNPNYTRLFESRFLADDLDIVRG